MEKILLFISQGVAITILIAVIAIVWLIILVRKTDGPPEEIR